HGSISSSRRLTCSTPQCGSVSLRSIRKHLQRSRAACSRRTSASIGRLTRRLSMFSARSATSLKTGSKGSRWELQHERRCQAGVYEKRCPPGRRWQRPGASRPSCEDRERQSFLRLRQGWDWEKHDVVEFVGGLLKARQAGVADRLRSQAR